MRLLLLSLVRRQEEGHYSYSSEASSFGIKATIVKVARSLVIVVAKYVQGGGEASERNIYPPPV